MKTGLLKRMLVMLMCVVLLVVASPVCFAAASGNTTISLYVQLGGNAPYVAETIPCDEVYNFETDGKVLMNKWHVSDRHYAFIGWFAMDKDGKPSKWLGEKGVKVAQGKNNSIIAVFNSRPGISSEGTSLRTYVQVGAQKAAAAGQFINQDSYSLQEDPATIAKEAGISVDFKKYSFAGWYYMDNEMQPAEKLAETTFSLKPGMYLNVVAVFGDASALAKIDEPKVPLAGSIDFAASGSGKVFEEVYATQRSVVLDMFFLAVIILGACAIVFSILWKRFHRE